MASPPFSCTAPLDCDTRCCFSLCVCRGRSVVQLRHALAAHSRAGVAVACHVRAPTRCDQLAEEADSGLSTFGRQSLSHPCKGRHLGRLSPAQQYYAYDCALVRSSACLAVRRLPHRVAVPQEVGCSVGPLSMHTPLLWCRVPRRFGAALTLPAPRA